jgi:hypothetical protein
MVDAKKLLTAEDAKVAKKIRSSLKPKPSLESSSQKAFNRRGRKGRKKTRKERHQTSIR